MTDEAKKNISVAALLPWLLAVMSLLCLAGAFLGAEKATDFFNSPAMAMIWILLDVLAVASVGMCLRRGLYGHALVSLGVALVLSGALVGSPTGLALADRLSGDEIPSVHHGYLVLPVGGASDMLVDARGEPAGRLGREVRLVDCGRSQADRPVLFAGVEGDFAAVDLNEGSQVELPGRRTRIAVTRFLPSVDKPDVASTARLAWISPDGEMSVCRSAAGQFVEDPHGDTAVFIREVIRDSRRAALLDENLQTRPGRPTLLVSYSERGADVFPLEFGRYVDLPDLQGAKLYFTGPGPKEPKPLAPSADASMPGNELHAVELSLSPGAEGDRQNALVLFHDYDLPLVADDLFHGPAQDVTVVIRPLDAPRAGAFWGLISEQRDGHQGPQQALTLNHPVAVGDYRLTLDSMLPGDAGLKLRVRHRRGSATVFSGMIVALSGLIFRFFRSNQR